MTLETRSRTSWWLFLVLGLSAIALASLAFAGILSVHATAGGARTAADHASIAADKARAAAKEVKLASDRTECIRAASAALDQARWDDVGALFLAATRAQVTATGRALQALPSITELADHGGTIEGKRILPCAPLP
jgi:hypothetical protein